MEEGLAKALESLHDFFHARTGPEACLLGGWIRIAYAFLFIMDRLLWSLELDFFFYQSGVLPTRVTRSYSYVENDSIMLTIFQLAPESDWLIWAVNYLCLVQGILLLLGVAPRFQLVCLIIYLASWEHQNDHAWDSQDVMLRFFGFLMCFMPLHRLTIYEWWQTRGMSKEAKVELYKDDSWPMWPFRLWQIEMCFVYAGAGLSKLSYKNWHNGLAVYYASYSNHFGGVFTPNFLFNRLWSLKLLCYGSLVIECLSWILIWPLATRPLITFSIILLHVGIDLSMNMNIFEWLSILGWMSFLARPSDRQNKTVQKDERSSDNESKPQNGRKLSQYLIDLFIVSFIFIYGCQTLPFYHIDRITPKAMEPIVVSIQDANEQVLELIDPWLHRLGIHQETWSMFCNPVKKSERYEAYITFKDGTRAKWWSPDWDSMTWLERKRNRRRQLYFNNLMEFESEDTTGQKRLCEWIAQQYEKEVVRIKLVYHVWKAPKPSPDLGWFDDARVPREEMEYWNETHYIHYTSEACREWAEEGECTTDPEFMLKRCGENCKGLYDHVENVKVGSRILVYSTEDSAYYSATVTEIQGNKSKRFNLKWDFTEFGEEWFILDEFPFVLVGEEPIHSHLFNSTGQFAYREEL